MLTNMGMSKGSMAMCTSLLYLPWVIKPLWSPFVDILRTKRWWITAMQVIMSAAFLLAAVLVPDITPDAASGTGSPVSVFVPLLIVFWISAFASATHDIAADGFYMLALESGDQSMFVGIRSTFYRLSSVFGQGVLVVLAGVLETRLGNIPRAWSLTLLGSSLLFSALTFYHVLQLPHPSDDRSSIRGGGPVSAASVLMGFGKTFRTFFAKRNIVVAVLFMLLFRLPEAFLVKMMNPFLLDPVENGGLGLSTEAVGIVYGTVGVAALTLGGIAGGIAASRWGLKKSLWPMSLSLALPCFVFVFLSACQPSGLFVISSCVALDQFGYGFGFTAYMLYMMYFSEGEFRTSHYSICTAFMALSMMIPGMVAGYLQECLGYRLFFWMVMVCCLATVAVTFLIRVDPDYGKKVKSGSSAGK